MTHNAAFSLVESKTLVFRPLSETATKQAFAKKLLASEVYINTIREFEGGVGYAIPIGRLTHRALKVNMGRAAKVLGLKLQWAKMSKDATELIVRLSDD